jgi:hypothetical protein
MAAEGLQGKPQGPRSTTSLLRTLFEALFRLLYLTQEVGQSSFGQVSFLVRGGESLPGAVRGCEETSTGFGVLLRALTSPMPTWSLRDRGAHARAGGLGNRGAGGLGRDRGD